MYPIYYYTEPNLPLTVSLHKGGWRVLFAHVEHSILRQVFGGGGQLLGVWTARQAADAALGARITDETNARIAGDLELRDRIASSTATAIAMGGAAILPDANFTVSGNVGFYQGAQAIALNAAGRVAPKTYITGSVGGGLNKYGSLGGRERGTGGSADELLDGGFCLTHA
jgi:hypothetical protein